MVGGTSSNGSRLQVTGSITTSGTSAGGYVGLSIGNTSTGAAQLKLNNSAQSWLVNTRTDNHYSIFNETSATTPFLITTAGNVGIGTTSPDNKLSVRNEASSAIAVIDVRGGVGGAGAVAISGNGTTLTSTSFDLIQNSAGAFVFQRDNNPLVFGTNNTEQMRITSGGELLINTTSDAGDYKLQVNGNTLLRGGTFFQGESGPAGDSIGQRIVGTITAGASGVAKKIIYCDHTNAITVKVIAYQNTSNNGSIVQSFTTSYGATTAGTATTSYVNNITGISLAYNNGGSPAYSIDCTVNYTGSAPTLYIIVEGVARSNMYLI